MHEALRFPKPFGKYVLLRQLAVGGMAEVYLARASGPAGFEKECVIKRILPSLASDKQFVQMFLDEARIAARLSHPNIVQIFELGEVTPADPFIAMEYVRGVDVQQILDAERARSGRVPLAVALRLVSHVAEGLDAAHRATDGRGGALGIVHRDVTPSNVIVSFDGVAKLCDFGIAKAVAKTGRTEVGVIKGKIPYMSPEQVEGQGLDARSDLFSVGVLMYELTTGQKPFDGTNPAEISIKILHDEPTPPQLIVGHFPEPLNQILHQALAKKSTDRFPTARDLQMAIEEFLVSSGIRCTSHEVAGYLENLFPGRRDQLDSEASQVAGPLPTAVTDPTVPMMLSGQGPPMGEHAPEPVIGDLDTSARYEDVRRNLGGGGGGTRWVVMLLVVAVAVGFWWLRGHMTPETSPPAPGASAPQPKVVAPGEATAPTGNPPPVQAPAPAPAPEKPAAAPAPKAVEEAPKPTELPSPTVAAPEPKETRPRPASPRPAAAKKPAPAHKPPAPAAKPEGERALPRLPSPPPEPDEAQ